MKYEEVKTRLVTALEDPDKLQSSIISLLDDLKVDYDGIDALNEELKKSNERIEVLQQEKNKLYISAIGKASGEDPNEITTPEENEIDPIEDFNQSIFSVASEQQQ